MISAVIFDCFGVLTEDAWTEFNNKYLGTDIYTKAHELNDQCDVGLISHEELYSGMAELLGKPAVQVERIFTSEHKHVELFDYIKNKLKGNYKLGMLSNVGKGFLENFLTDDEKSLFDTIILSGEIGVAKPDARAYEAILDAFGSTPQQCVMIDDRQYNVDGAKKVGMRAILYKDFEQMKLELENFLADSKD